MPAEFTAPEVRLGDQVFWYHDTLNLTAPLVGWVSRDPGQHTIAIIVFAPDVGFLEKQSVRHKDDPGLAENPAWRTWGCWDFSPAHKDMKRAISVSASVAANHERTKVSKS
jgi:hypothetical protein